MRLTHDHPKSRPGPGRQQDGPCPLERWLIHGAWDGALLSVFPSMPRAGDVRELTFHSGCGDYAERLAVAGLRSSRHCRSTCAQREAPAFLRRPPTERGADTRQRRR
jgi:hypothetical protein